MNNSHESTKNPDGLSYIIPVTGLPAFRGSVETGINLTCANGCNQILIERYDPSDFIKIGVQCVLCGHITRTPSMSEGEVFCAHPIHMSGKDGATAYYINATVQHPSGVVITIAEELDRVRKSTSPKILPIPLEMTESGLMSLVEKYDRIVGNLYALQRKKIEQNPAQEKREFPFAWSIFHLEKCIRRGVVNPRDPDTLAAITWLTMFCDVVGRWGHHPRFNTVGQSIGKPKSFIHTCSQLMAAAYLYQFGNQIGLSLEDECGQPNPDLYIRLAGGGKLFMEVKAPQSLQPYGSMTTLELIEKTVKACIKKSSAQINRGHRGMLIISSTATNPDLPAHFQQTIARCVDAKGRDHHGLAAVIGMASAVQVPMWTTDLNLISNAFKFSIKINKFYDGPNPIAADRRSMDNPYQTHPDARRG